MSVGMLVRSKPKGRPRTSERDDVTVRLDRAIVAKAKVIAARRDVSLAELLSEMVRETVDQSYDKMVEEMSSERSGRPKGGKGGN